MAGNADALALLERIVNINSGTMNFPGGRQVGDVLRAEFDALGFTTRWVDGSGFHRAGHPVAEHPGDGPRILLIGHLDTVFEPSHPFQRFERLSDSTARGPGIIDMKGGDLVVLHALKALQAAGAADVSFVATQVEAAIDGIGLAGSDDHTDRETAGLRMLAPLTKRAAILLYRIGGRPAMTAP